MSESDRLATMFRIFATSSPMRLMMHSRGEVRKTPPDAPRNAAKQPSDLRRSAAQDHLDHEGRFELIPRHRVLHRQLIGLLPATLARSVARSSFHPTLPRLAAVSRRCAQYAISH